MAWKKINKISDLKVGEIFKFEKRSTGFVSKKELLLLIKNDYIRDYVTVFSSIYKRVDIEITYNGRYCILVLV